MIGQAANDSSWSDFLRDCLVPSNLEAFTEDQLKELTELRESAFLLEYLLSGPQTVH